MSSMNHNYQDGIVELDTEELDSVTGGIIPVPLIILGASVLSTTAVVGFVDGVFSGIAKSGGEIK